METTKILTVEDDAIIGSHLQYLLKNLGYTVVGPLTSGEEAIKIALEIHPDMILMDVQLEGEIDGIEAAQKIQSTQDIPIIYITAFADEKALERAKITSPFGYLLKPFDERILHTTIEMALNKHKLEHELKESESRFRTLVENQGEGILIADMKETIVFANPAAESIFGFPKGTLVGKNFKEFTDKSQFASIKKQTRLRKEGKKSVYEMEIKRSDGEVRSLLVAANPWIDKETGLSGAFGVFRDITEIKVIQAAEKEQRLLAEALLDIASAIGSSLKLDEVYNLILVNLGKVVPHDTANIMLVEGETVRVVRAKGYEKAGLNEAIDKIRFNLKEVPEFLEMASTGRPMLVADSAKEKDWVNLSNSDYIRSYVSAPINVKGKTVGFINVDSHQPDYFDEQDSIRLKGFADQVAVAIENARLYNQMEHLAVTDELTGVFNRRGIIDLGQRELNRAIRFKHPFALVWIDFDDFKFINDTYGHIVGDQVLKEMIDFCQKNLRDFDLIGRMGGDEFVILLPETDLDGGILLAERLRNLLENHSVQSPMGKISLTASFGVTALSEKDKEFAKLLSNADSAMYQAKQAGMNRVSSI
jgi:diguanylate cyclase (GGDEF)-like protein/PAS domain S-box-containing protein